MTDQLATINDHSFLLILVFIGQLYQELVSGILGRMGIGLCILQTYNALDNFVALGESKATSHKAHLSSFTVVHEIRHVSIRFLINAYDSRG